MQIAPAMGHEDRFRQKLAYQPARKVNFRHVLQIAASIAVILASAFVLIRTNRSGDKVAVHEIPASVMEADQYYSTQVNHKVDQIRQFDFDNDEGENGAPRRTGRTGCLSTTANERS